MQLTDVLSADPRSGGLCVSSKKSLLEKAAELLASASDTADAREVFESLCQRERLGSTGLGHGVAIPHGRVSGQAGVSAAMIRLSTPIDFDAPDSEKVDLFFALSVPEQCSDLYLRLLAEMAERLGNADHRERLRAAASGEDVLKLLAIDLSDSAG
ncbi:MAG: PTS sugar transporter subunit IIA [Wenzhouxiangella sp.]